MIAKAIILLGNYRDVNRQVHAVLANREDTIYFPSLLDHMNYWEANTVVASVMNKEFERDQKEVIPALQLGMNAVIEQWHLGNWAVARYVRSSVESIYARKLEQYLPDLPVSVSVIYASWPDAYLLDSPRDEADAVSGLAREIAFVLQYFNISPMTVDSGAPDALAQTRVKYLFDTTLKRV